MANNMKKIYVSSRCVACGLCVANSEFMQEDDDGYAIPREPGLITSEQYNEFEKIEKDCPVQAILVEDDSISALVGSDAIIQLKEMINETIKNYKILAPVREEYNFDRKNYKVPSLISDGISRRSYKSYDKALDEGFDVFENTMYSQKKALIQAVCVEYKTKQLKKFAYYNKETGNYYYDHNMKISKLLKEAVAIGQAISGNKMNIPSDFYNFDIGPDNGFDGNSYCWVLRDLEELTWDSKIEEAYSYKYYIAVEEYFDEYKYSLDKIESVFREDILDCLHYQLYTRVDDAIDSAYKHYCETFKKELGNKLSLLNTELKNHVKIEKSPKARRDDLVKDIKVLLTEIKSTPLKKQTIYKHGDEDYDNSYRFSSHSKADEAGSNRAYRSYSEYSDYLRRSSNNISEDLGKEYQKQFEGILNTFKTKLQEVFDKHETAYPEEALFINGGQYSIPMTLCDYEEIDSNMNWDIRDFIDRQVVGSSDVLKSWDYFTYSDMSYTVYESITWKQGLFGEKEVPIYAYTVNFGCRLGFQKAVSFCCDYVYKHDYLKSFREDMLKSLEEEVLKILV